MTQVPVNYPQPPVMTIRITLKAMPLTVRFCRYRFPSRHL